MEIKHYVITSVVAYAFFLIISTPAATITGLFDESIPQVSIQGVNGTVWNGTAQKITLAANHTINDVNWSVCVWRLITAEVCVNLEATYLNKPIKSQLGIGITGTFQARNLNAEMDAQSLETLAALPIGELSGLILIQLKSVSWTKEQIPSAIGDIIWKDAAITVAETANLGDVAIALTESDDFPLAATIHNKGGHVTVNGEMHIDDDGSYNLELKLLPNTTASKNLRASLEMFAKQQNDGSFAVKNTGNLKQFGIM